MGRLRSWDYKKPYFYMVTLMCRKGMPPLARLDAHSEWGLDLEFPLTKALSKTIFDFAATSPGLDKIEPFIIMPDHIHLLFKLNEHPERHSLMMYVKLLKFALERTFKAVTGVTERPFESEWHDLIVKRAHQLVNFTYYIYQNPRMGLLRQAHPKRFYCHRGVRHWRLGGVSVDAVGNLELLNEPAMVAVRISRSVVEGDDAWKREVDRWKRCRPGMTAVGTWWSKGEKAAFCNVLEHGGNVIVLSPNGFPERWHPAGMEVQKYCAEGRMLYLSPYPPQAAVLAQGVPRMRCQELNALAKQMEAAICGEKRR